MNKIIITILLAGCSMVASAQDYRIEVRAKAAWHFTHASYPSEPIASDYIAFAQGEAYYFFRPGLGAGVFYGRSIGESGYTDAPIIMSDDPLPQYQHYGIKAMASTDRTKRFSVYATLMALKAEQAIDFTEFKVASSGIGFGGGVGLNIKITRSVSFNLFEAYVIKYSDSFGLGGDQPSLGFGFSSGLVFKFLRER